MPRIHPRLFRQARTIDSILPRLLPVCRDLRSAQSELRWLREHVTNKLRKASARTKGRLLNQYVARRARHEPLQYILGTEFFGDLEIKCRPGVLIPRQETAASVSHLVHLLSFRYNEAKKGVERPPTLRVLDLCTGTGCIPLLFHHEFYSRSSNSNVSLDLVGVDVSAIALDLARENRRIQLQQASSTDYNVDGLSQHQLSLQRMKFLQANILRPESLFIDNGNSNSSPPPPLHVLRDLNGQKKTPTYDILISNPPYVSPFSYKRTTTRSVRDYEPKLALVPPPPSSSSSQESKYSSTSSQTLALSTSPYSDNNGRDTFYPHLLRHTSQVEAEILLFEVADFEQAHRVATLALQDTGWKVEIWRDDPAATTNGIKAVDHVVIDDMVVPVRGSGHGRSVFAYKKGSWFRR